MLGLQIMDISTTSKGRVILSFNQDLPFGDFDEVKIADGFPSEFEAHPLRENLYNIFHTEGIVSFKLTTKSFEYTKEPNRSGMIVFRVMEEFRKSLNQK